MLEVAFTQKIDLAPILLDENKKLKLFSASSYKGLDRPPLFLPLSCPLWYCDRRAPRHA
jgi:hypothetical protein